MKKFLLLCLVVMPTLSAISAFGQNAQIDNGVIVYEKKVDVYSFLDSASMIKGIGDIRERYESTNPQFKTTIFTLDFNADKTLYEPVQPDGQAENEILDFIGQMAARNIIYTDLSTREFVGMKNVLGTKFLIRDSIRKINWKMRTETRDIAGFHCLRADAFIMDSLYVIAFFCDQIATQGGPESFTGLPGMILGVALPRSNTTWFATGVTVGQSNRKPITPPGKGNPAKVAEFKTSLEKSQKNSPFKKIILENSLL
jgi:GLPGLI family protein